MRKISENNLKSPRKEEEVQQALPENGPSKGKYGKIFYLKKEFLN